MSALLHPLDMPVLHNTSSMQGDEDLCCMYPDASLDPVYGNGCEQPTVSDGIDFIRVANRPRLLPSILLERFVGVPLSAPVHLLSD